MVAVMLERRGSSGALCVDPTRLLRALNSRESGELVVGVDGWPFGFEEQRYIGKCKVCKRAVSTLLPGKVNQRTEHAYGYERVRRWVEVLVWTSTGLADWAGTVECPGCEKPVAVVAVSGKHNPDHPCDARCTSAKGPSCECSCGGANHGADWGGE